MEKCMEVDEIIEGLVLCLKNYKYNKCVICMLLFKLYGYLSSSDIEIRMSVLQKLLLVNNNFVNLLVEYMSDSSDILAINAVSDIVSQILWNQSDVTDISKTTTLVMNHFVSQELDSVELFQALANILIVLSYKDKQFSENAELFCVLPFLNSALIKCFRDQLPFHHLCICLFKRICSEDGYLEPLGEDDQKLENNLSVAGQDNALLSTIKAMQKLCKESGEFRKMVIKSNLIESIVLSLAERPMEGKIKNKICSNILLMMHELGKRGKQNLRSYAMYLMIQKLCAWVASDKALLKLFPKIEAILYIANQPNEQLLLGQLSPLKFKVETEKEYDDYLGDYSDDSDFEDSDTSLQCMTDHNEDFNDIEYCGDRYCLENNNYEETSQEKLSNLEYYKSYWSELKFLQCDSSSRMQGSTMDKGNSDLLQNESVMSYEYLNTLTRIKMHLEQKFSFGGSWEQMYNASYKITNCIQKFAKIAYPDVHVGHFSLPNEGLSTKASKNFGNMVRRNAYEKLVQSPFIERTVFDLDQLIKDDDRDNCVNDGMNDKLLLGRKYNVPYVLFESRFEGGNLRRAIQVGPLEYNLILTPDVNSSSHHNWFYFQVTNMQANSRYCFNILNLQKKKNQFKSGMKPLIYSVKKALQGKPRWERGGYDIIYYRSISHKDVEGKNHKRKYFTLTFYMKFKYSSDICYISFHYPYTYSRLMTQMCYWNDKATANNIYFQPQKLCDSLNQNEVPIITITAMNSKTNPIEHREIIFLTSRVHPGESNASWIMEGTIDFLLSNSLSAISTLNYFIFKIVPMLNTEGVINGCHRCGLTNQDLNRVWSMPDPKLNPEIYHTKNMMEYCVKALKKSPYMYIDYHGHCQERNFFVYGCHKSQSWNFKDIENTSLEPSMKVVESYAHVMSELSPFFSLNSCKFDILQHREGTARVAVWREFNISKSYTVETSICGTDRSSKKPHHFNIEHLKNIGADLMMGILQLFNLSELKLDLKVNEPLGDSTSGNTKLIDPITCRKFSLLKTPHDGDIEANNQDSDDSD